MAPITINAKEARNIINNTSTNNLPTNNGQSFNQVYATEAFEQSNWHKGPERKSNSSNHNYQEISTLDIASLHNKDDNITTILDENMTDYYTHKETTRQSEIYSDTISDDDMWDSVSTYNHTSSSSNMHTVDSTINNISGNKPRQRRSRPRPNNRAVRDVAAGTSHQPTKDSGYCLLYTSPSPRD